MSRGRLSRQEAEIVGACVLVVWNWSVQRDWRRKGNAKVLEVAKGLQLRPRAWQGGGAERGEAAEE